MIAKKDFKKLSEWLWEIPQSFRQDMRVPARIYVSEKMLEDTFGDKSIDQLVNVATLPGITKYSLAMPDIHEGYGFPIGGVAAMDISTGVISPGGVGYDINCGVRALKSNLEQKEAQPFLDKLAIKIQREVPSGLGRGRQIKLDTTSVNKILEGGVKRLVEKGFGEKEDIESCESEGQLPQADASTVSEKAKNRGRDQVGTLGSGNHFLEIQKVEKIFEEEVAKIFGLFPDQILIMIHTGSRGLGHQIATDYIREMMRAMLKYGIILPDRELAASPINSPEGKGYFSAMACGANYAWANRQMITHYVRKAWTDVLGSQASSLELLYDVAHNIAKIEEHEVNGKPKKLVVHRKGATRAFPPQHPEIPKKYQKVGQPVIIPGTMGTASYILVGTEKSKEAWYTVCHGAGRVMSRHAAIRSFPGNQVVQNLETKGIIVKYWGLRGIAEEAPGAYKDVDDVVEVIHSSGLSKKVARLVPLAVIKGE
ncbi:tRNA-splicing ligase [Parcubacteria bacterium DG_74_3]|nr:MAG: tRNA-splicing ligase [Parcubacteria bacterium DG_74_3]